MVDFGALGGGVEQACAEDGGGATAADLFRAAGYRLTEVMRQPGFVCRVDGRPAEDACVVTPPADAYWGLWWSDGTSTDWSYAAMGAAALTVRDGSAVALAWQSGNERRPPSVPVAASGDGGPPRSPAPVGDAAEPAGPAGGDRGLPVWVAPVGIGALFAVAGAVALFRRRRA